MHVVEKLAHLDIKPDNIMIKENLTLAFIDFAQAAPLNEQRTGVCGTDKYWPPEVL
jgi:serine/threonine protein kinase